MPDKLTNDVSEQLRRHKSEIEKFEKEIQQNKRKITTKKVKIEQDIEQIEKHNEKYIDLVDQFGKDDIKDIEDNSLLEKQ